MLGDYAWYEGNAWAKGARSPLPVGLKRPNPWGLYDIYGNAWEWVQEKLWPSEMGGHRAGAAFGRRYTRIARRMFQQQPLHPLGGARHGRAGRAS